MGGRDGRDEQNLLIGVGRKFSGRIKKALSGIYLFYVYFLPSSFSISPSIQGSDIALEETCYLL